MQIHPSINQHTDWRLHSWSDCNGKWNLSPPGQMQFSICGKWKSTIMQELICGVCKASDWPVHTVYHHNWLPTWELADKLELQWQSSEATWQRICLMELSGGVLQGLGRRFSSKWIVNEKGSFRLIQIFHQFYPNENITLDCGADLRHIILYSSDINLCVFRVAAGFVKALCRFPAFLPILFWTGQLTHIKIFERLRDQHKDYMIAG